MTDADVGGAERLVALLARHWNPDDTLKLTILLEPGTLSPELEDSFAEVSYLNFARSSRRLDRMVKLLEREIEEFKPDAIVSQLFHADLITALARTSVPKVSVVHTQRLGPKDHPLTKAIARAVGLLSHRFAAVVPVSASDDMSAFLKRLRMKGVVDAIENSADVPDVPNFDPSSRSFGMIVRNHAVKGHGDLLAAFSMIAEKHPRLEATASGPRGVSKSSSHDRSDNSSGGG